MHIQNNEGQTLQNMLTFVFVLEMVWMSNAFGLEITKSKYTQLYIKFLILECFFMPTNKQWSALVQPKQQNYFSCAQSFHHLVLTSRVVGGGACSIVTDTRSSHWGGEPATMDKVVRRPFISPNCQTGSFSHQSKCNESEQDLTATSKYQSHGQAGK